MMIGGVAIRANAVVREVRRRCGLAARRAASSAAAPPSAPSSVSSTQRAALQTRRLEGMADAAEAEVKAQRRKLWTMLLQLTSETDRVDIQLLFGPRTPEEDEVRPHRTAPPHHSVRASAGLRRSGPSCAAQPCPRRLPRPTPRAPTTPVLPPNTLSITGSTMGGRVWPSAHSP